MTKEITKSIILQQMESKFGLREFEPENFLFSETVIPIYDTNREVIKPKPGVETVSVSSTGGKIFFTVPQDEKWYLHTYNVVLMTGSYKVTGLYLLRAGYPASTIYLDMTEGQTVSYAVHLPLEVPLLPGDQLKVLVDDYTSTGNLRLYIDYLMEKIR